MTNQGDDDMGIATEIGLPAFITRSARKARKLAKNPVVVVKQPKDYSTLEHRLKHDEHEIGGQNKGGVTSHKITNPLRIDKLLHNGVISEEQHNHGMQIIAFWMIAGKPFLGSMRYEERQGNYNVEDGTLSRMTAEDRFYKTMAYLASPHTDYLRDMRKILEKTLSRKERRTLVTRMQEIAALNKRAHMRAHDLICRVCFDELGAIEAAKAVGVDFRDAADCIRDAFDSLGEALKKMRRLSKEMEKTAQVETEKT